MNKRQYQKELDKILQGLESRKEPEPVPTLFLHSCCAPCSSYVLEYLGIWFEITVFYYNPNISFSPEYQMRVREQKRLIEIYNKEGNRHPIKMMESDYVPQEFFKEVKGLETQPEGAARCNACFGLRLRETARIAAAEGYDYFATTLTISPVKNAGRINQIGGQMAAIYGVPWLPSDFKKKNGYKRSVELSEKYGLYRQDYCGCVFSRRESQIPRSNGNKEIDNRREKG